MGETTPQPWHVPEEDRLQAGTTLSPLLPGAEKLAPLGRREQALTWPYSSQLSYEQIERVRCGFGELFLPHPCPNLRGKLKPPKKQVTCPDSTPRARAAPTFLKKYFFSTTVRFSFYHISPLVLFILLITFFLQVLPGHFI